jgi:hypothetical protein
MPGLLDKAVNRIKGRGVATSSAWPMAVAALQKAGDLKKGTVMRSKYEPWALLAECMEIIASQAGRRDMAKSAPKPNIRSTGGQNKPPSGGPAGAGKARGAANLATTAKTTPGNVTRKSK